MLPTTHSCSSHARQAVRCNAAGRRGGGGGSKQGRASGPPGGGSSSSSSGAASAAKLSAAAKAAAKRAAAFARQRQERAFEQAQLAAGGGGAGAQQPTLPGWRAPQRGGPRAAAAAAGADADPDTDHQQQQQQLQPYVDVITAHLKKQQQQQSGADGSGSSSGSGGGGRGRGAKRGAVQALMEAHTAAFQAALDLELQQEWLEAEERLQSWPPARLASEGVALFGLAAAPDGGVARDVVLRFFVPNEPLPFHSFSQGDILLVSRGDPLADSHEAVVVDFSSRWIRLALRPDAAAAIASASGSSWRGSGSSSNGSNGGGGRPHQQRQRGCIWRLDLFANTVSHERCSEGLARFAAAVTQQQLGVASGLSQAVAAQQELLCRVLAGVVPPGTPLAAAAGASPPWAKSPRGRERLAAARSSVKGLVRDGSINASQGAAIELALGRTLTLWQGPPGTGKTATLLRFCQAALTALGGPDGGGGGAQLLAVAASNVAVDQMVGGLLALGMKVVRLGQPVKVTPALRSVTLEVLAAATGPGQAAAKLRQQLVAAAAATRGSSSSSSMRGGRGGTQGGRRGGRGSSSSGRGSSGGSGGSVWEQVLALEAAAAAEVLGGAQVVAATCVGAGDPVLAGRSFALLVLDEATQAPEPAALTAIAQQAQAALLVGDPAQLPPTVRCRGAEKLGLAVSLFERVQAMGLAPSLLDTQYRMHPALASFPSAAFYGGRLSSAPTPRERPLPAGLAWPNHQVPVMFVQVDGREARTAASLAVGAPRGREAAAASSSSSGSSLDDDSEQQQSLRGKRPVKQRPSSSSSSSSSVGGGGGGHSYFNATEAAVAAGVVGQLLDAGMPPGDVCVITPYSGQVREIQRQLPAALTGAAAAGLPQRAAHSSVSSSRRSGGAPLSPRSPQRTPAPAGAGVVEIKSVDGFQGREKEVVVFSAVRCNPQRHIGFLADARRLNVALTRARRGLVVVGDAATLSADPVWRRWLAWARREGCCVEGATAGGDRVGAGGGDAVAAGVGGSAVSAQ